MGGRCVRYGWIGGRKDGWAACEVWVDRWAEGWVGGRMGGFKEWMGGWRVRYGWIGGRKDGWAEGWVGLRNGWVGGRMYKGGV
jgi:hypothetical protein